MILGEKIYNLRNCSFLPRSYALPRTIFQDKGFLLHIYTTESVTRFSDLQTSSKQLCIVSSQLHIVTQL
jgi:hypothetical protein